MLRKFAILLLIFCPLRPASSAELAEAAGTAGHGRVLAASHPEATLAFTPQAAVINRMVAQGIAEFAGLPTAREAWHSLISTQDVIGIKVHSAPGRTSGTRPVVVAAILESLLGAGFKPGQIIIWDRRLTDLRLAGYLELGEKFQVTVAGALEAGHDPAVFYTSSLLGRLVFGDLEFGKKGEGIGRNSYVSSLITRKITKIINVPPLLNHNLAGVSGAVFGLALASVDNVLRFDDQERLASALPEIYALPELADRVVLNIVDALICQYQGEERSLLHYSTPLNQLWFSADPVAVDVLAMDEMDRARPGTEASRKTARQIYANAAIMDLGRADRGKILVQRLNVQ